MNVVSIFTDLTTGWRTTLKRWSAKLNLVQGLAICGITVLISVWPTLIVAVCSLIVISLLGLAALVSANLTQKNVGTYDKRTHRVVRIEVGDETQ